MQHPGTINDFFFAGLVVFKVKKPKITLEYGVDLGSFFCNKSNIITTSEWTVYLKPTTVYHSSPFWTSVPIDPPFTVKKEEKKKKKKRSLSFTTYPYHLLIESLHLSCYLDPCLKNVSLISKLLFCSSQSTMPSSNPSSRLPKRSRVSDAAISQVVHAADDRVKRRRFSQSKSNSERGLKLTVPKTSQGSTGNGNDEVQSHSVDQAAETLHASWSLSQLAAGQYSNVDPVLTSDEE